MTVSTAIRWPAAATTPRAPLRAGIARVVFDHAVRRVRVRVTYPDGRVLGAGSPASPELAVVRPAAFLARLGRDAKIGFGEAYMAGDWRAGSGTDLADLLTSFAARLTTLIPPALQRLRVFVDRRVPPDQENTLDGSRSNIAAHYDLSNDLFAAFLDPTMTYSSAWFDDSEPVETATRLEEAQLRKIDGILDLAGVRSGTRLLEIGTGWGTLAIRAAQRGARVTTITLSREQMRLARERVEAAGLSGLVEVRVQDYREVDGEYDAIVSVEMIEAVGEAYWPAYFAALDRLLAPGGRVAIQAITMDHDRFLATRRSFSWIQKYIFPGGIIPSLQAVDEHPRGPHHAARDAAARAPAALRPDPAPVAGTLPRPVAPHPRPGLRRDLPPHVGVLPRLQRGRLPQRLPRRQPAPDDQEAGMKLNGKVAWVVGGSSGIGAAVARELARRGATVAISARRKEQLQDVSGGDMLVLPADVTDAAAVAAAAARVREELGPIDLAVLSAGYWKQMDPADWDTEVFDQHIRVNLAGMSNSIAAVLPGMLRRHHGVIAGIASVAGYRGLAGAEAYGATKAAQINLLESLRVHIARTGVHVTTICPGFVRTDLTAGNPFPMPFIIDAGQAARSICDGLERDRTEIVFPTRMALLMKTARLVPARAWTALWARTSLT